MAAAVKTITTAGVPTRDRPLFWARALGNLVGQVDVRPMGSEIHGNIGVFKLARLQLAEIEGRSTQLVMSAARTSKPRLPSIHILFQREGRSLIEQDGMTIEVGPGDCLAYDFERQHRIVTPDMARVHSLRIPRELLTANGFDLRRMSPVRLTGDPMASIAGDLLASIIDRWAQIDSGPQVAMADALANFLMPSLSRQIDGLRPLSHGEMLRSRAIAFIGDNLADPDLDVARLAQALGCTRRYLHMVFADSGSTVSRTIWQMRLERARRHIEEGTATQKSMTGIAFACGFSSSAHFSRLFRDRYGYPPSHARRAGR